MAALYTKNGKPLQQRGKDLYSRSGKHIGRISGRKVFDRKGKYAGTIDGDRVVYRSSDRGEASTSFTPAPIAGTAAANAGRSAIWGDEPAFPD
jgi:hypothetical protein